MSTLETITAILENAMGKHKKNINPNDSLFDDLNLDGDTFDSFLSDIEEHFDIVFEEDDIDTFDTVNDIAAFIDINQ